MNALLFFQSMIRSQKQGTATGICSVCSAHYIVLEAAMEHAAANGQPLLLEATANQINQFGGYMGMKPPEFREMVYRIADGIGFPRESVILGGDHLGPLTWRGEEEETAMQKAEELVRLFVSAGFSKIHLDTSMHLADDDPGVPLPDEKIARRAARLCKAAEEAAGEASGEAAGEAAEQPPVYVIGSEVPPPGGATENEDTLQVTGVEALRETISVFRETFLREGLEGAWKRVIAVVVQPGVEFSDNKVILYDREKAEGLTGFIKGFDSLVLEGHSTDYQPRELLTKMKEDGIAILKVGPAVTFALREGLFALEKIERELYPKPPAAGFSDFADTLDKAMLEDPSNWDRHYHGTDEELAVQRKFSLSDRCRYYLSDPRIEQAISRLRENLRREIPLGLLMQYLPAQAQSVIAGRLQADFDSLVKAKIKEVLDTYIKIPA